MPESLISDPIALADNVTGYFLFADPQYIDVADVTLNGWDGREYTCVGLRVDHLDGGGKPCNTTVSFSDSIFEPTATGDWTLEERDPVTVTPGIECERCDFAGSVTDGEWV